jgi:hypothetical protein
MMGGVTMIGTPSNMIKSFFYRVTCALENGWKVSKWSYKDNPYTSRQVQETIDLLIKNRAGIETTPRFRQMYYGEWVIDLDKLVYKYNPKNNRIYELKESREMITVMGVDLGFDDATAYTIATYSRYNDTVYFKYSFKKTGQIISDVADLIKELKKKYDIQTIVIDGANKQAVEEMRQRHFLQIKAAEKIDKVGFIEIMNSDFVTGHIKVMTEDCADLVEEYESLIWDEKKFPKRVEHSALANHCADSALYAWRYCKNYLAEQMPKTKGLHSEDYINDWWDKEEGKLLQEQNEFSGN